LLGDLHKFASWQVIEEADPGLRSKYFEEQPQKRSLNADENSSVRPAACSPISGAMYTEFTVLEENPSTLSNF
jgi:hypothetical protein